MRLSLTALSLSVAMPAAAQTAIVPPDLPAANIEAAQSVVDIVWPIGTYKRIVGPSMESFMNQALESAMGMTVDQAELGGESVEGAEGQQSLGQFVKQADPYFDERMKISVRVFSQEMAALLDEIEPQFQNGMVKAYAQRFTVPELQEMRAFFETPTGRKYAVESVTLMQDPEIMKAARAFQPIFLGRLPALLKKIEAATAHLPPPPKKRGMEDEEPSAEESAEPAS
ncbi:MAG TPA: DUF2059 domain-containing protein [Allosphingosinicella sp.]